MADYLPAQGNDSEVRMFKDVMGHYQMAREDLDQRIQRKNGFNDADKMFSSHIDAANWPYKSMIFDPRPYTVIIEKSARLMGSKPKGRMVPREGGDTLGAYICNELFSFQWDDHSRLGRHLIGEWQQKDQATRKYGSAFSLHKWRYEVRVNRQTKKREVVYDGPEMILCNPRDVLANPGYSYVKNWFQHREYLTIDELEKVNDAARKEPIYKNLDILKDAVKKSSKSGGGDSREASVANFN